MTLLYMDGFEAHVPPRFGGLDVGAGTMQDAGLYWRGGTPNRYSFVEGYEGGQSFSVGSSSQGWATSSIGGQTATRVGFWARGGSTFNLGFWIVSLGAYHVEVTTGGLLRLVDGSAIVATTTSGFWNADWRHYEFYANVSGVLELRVNGVLVASGQASPRPGPLQVVLGRQQVFQNNQHRYDHMYITDGPPLEGDGIYGVSVVAGIDRYGSNDQLQGSMVIGGNRYGTAPASAVVDSTSAYANDANLSNIRNFIFPRNPSTGEAWDQSGLDSIDQWGLCYITVGNPTELRLTVAHLAILEAAQGGPVIKVREAAGVSSYSTTTRKTNPDIPISAHVRSVPRDPAIQRDDATALFISGEGCIMFGTDSSGGIPSSPIGLTFAEEFREDYKDWVRVDGVGDSFESYFISGYSVLGEGNRKFQDNYVTVNYENIPTGKAYIQGLWDYSESPNTGRWSMRQVIENKGGEFRHAHRRVKIRGHGKALSLKVTNHGDYPFIINGWTVLATSNQSV